MQYFTAEQEHDIYLNVFGTGAFSYPWWSGYAASDEGWPVTVGSRNPDTGEEATHRVTVEAVINAAESLIVDDRYNSTFRSELRVLVDDPDSADLDANGADLILQTVCFNDIVYG